MRNGSLPLPLLRQDPAQHRLCRSTSGLQPHRFFQLFLRRRKIAALQRLLPSLQRTLRARFRGRRQLRAGHIACRAQKHKDEDQLEESKEHDG